MDQPAPGMGQQGRPQRPTGARHRSTKKGKQAAPGVAHVTVRRRGPHLPVARQNRWKTLRYSSPRRVARPAATCSVPPMPDPTLTGAPADPAVPSSVVDPGATTAVDDRPSAGPPPQVPAVRYTLGEEIARG